MSSKPRSLLANLRRRWRDRSHARTSTTRFGEVPAVATQLPDWLRRNRRTKPADLVAAAQPFLIDAEHLAAAERAALAGRLAEACAQAEQLRELPVEERLRAWLAATGRWVELADLVAERAYVAGQYPTVLVGGRLYADFGELQPTETPEAMLEVEPALCGLELRIRRCALSDAGVDLELFAVVRALDYAAYPPRIEVTGPALLGARQVDDPAATRFSARRHQCHDQGALQVRIADAESDLSVTLHAGDFQRSAVLSAARIRARLPQLRSAADQVSDVVVVGDAVRLVGPGLVLPLRGRRRFRPEGPLAPGPLDLPDLQPDPALAGRLPLELAAAHHRVEVTAPDGRLELRLAAPLRDDERGPFRQTQLQSRHGAAPIDRGLALFTSYAGTAVTDSPLAIQQELARREPGLRMLWAVADHAVPVPEGTEPVLVRSREWYDAWSTAALVVTNVEPDRWYRPRKDQLLVQTFHGYPSKTMGKVLWRSKNFSPRRIRYQLDHTSGTWSLLVTPEQAMDRHYREQYDWTGPIVHEGYPRNDALVGESALRRREQVRAELGIGDRIAVLHAPTWRDDLASDFRAAEQFQALDVGAFTRALPDHVLLMRGHRFHAAGSDRPGVIDVTDHPEINDLILAADVAVLDYSSLRFDFAITGRPLVFLVPDLADYAHGSRGFLYPFEETTPGPLVADTAAVISEVGDPAALRDRYAAELDAFNARFNRHHDGHASSRVVDAILGLRSRRESAPDPS
ncbi:CDP-glycerol glycerophosphotransferase family protein [Nocardioides daejeonensis]|uniref:CDP-glycerol glycerophosphotransferase family protein n=1 Tax=Nocardioides daejeonensis TaxID=1046556 RepID=UPI000D7412DF|nr:CDP-glycerol glycerophosphotransferase family protein [Nocardioides daejeonensis]